MHESRNKHLRYERVPVDSLQKWIGIFYDRFHAFLICKGFSPETEINISFLTIIDIIARVDRRKAYYWCFHGMAINECKEVALYAYWIIKLRPFTITDKRYNGLADACTINESFAIYLIGLTLENIGKIKRTDNVKSSYHRFLEYSFRFRSFSIDSFIVLVESISTETLEKEYLNFPEPN
jgi:hypothetical protein